MSTRDQILAVLLDWDESWKKYNKLQEELNLRFGNKIAIGDLKIIMNQLKDDGEVVYENCFNDDGVLCGSGYFIHTSY